jgi:hypothetical protein
MARSHPPFSTLLCAVLAAACPGTNPNDETQGAATSTTSTTSGNQSGSVTSAPGTATDGTFGDSAPTMAGTTSAPGTGGSTSEPCSFPSCDDMSQHMDGCNAYTQDCPEGQKCSAYIHGSWWDRLKCVDVIGTDQPGDMCTSEGSSTGIDSCIRGAMCWDLDENSVGTCYALCTGSAESPVCEFPGYCVMGGEDVLNLCFGYCSPLLQDCPVPGEFCYPSNGGFVCIPDASGGAGDFNEPCQYINGCKPGLTCADAAFVGMDCPPGSAKCCTSFCEFPGGTCPNPDQQCVQYYDPALLLEGDPLLDIGTCGVPG